MYKYRTNIIYRPLLFVPQIYRRTIFSPDNFLVRQLFYDGGGPYMQ